MVAKEYNSCSEAWNLTNSKISFSNALVRRCRCIRWNMIKEPKSSMDMRITRLKSSMNMRITRLKIGEKKDIWNNPNHQHHERQSCWIQPHWQRSMPAKMYPLLLSISCFISLQHFPYPEEKQPINNLFTNNSKKLKKEFKRTVSQMHKLLHHK